MAVEGRFPEPVVAARVTTRIHTFWEILFNELPKFTVTGVLLNVPKLVDKVAGEEVTVVNEVGASPTPY
jgi:hypothetical protein